ncbi:MAG: DUF2510 domain-containing protein [Microbacteriaceae bacterium]
MTQVTYPPPGWYSGGVVGQERWWSGTEWTEHYRATSPATPRIRATGNVTGSLIGGIVGLCVAFFALVATLLALFSGSFFVIFPPFFAFIICGGVGAWALWNAFALKRAQNPESTPQKPPAGL